MNRNLVLSPSAGNGDDCFYCLEPVKQGEPCVFIEIKRVKIMGIPTSDTERAHRRCIEDLRDCASAAAAQVEKVERKMSL